MEFEMADNTNARNRREFLGTATLALSGAVAGASILTRPGTASARSAAVKEPAVIGYRRGMGITMSIPAPTSAHMGLRHQE